MSTTIQEQSVAKKAKVPVSERALVARINRNIAKEGKALRRRRGTQWESTLGDYYIVNVERNWIVDTHIDIEEYGREIGVLAAYEALNEEAGS